jgi:hypothetical protein
MSQLPPLGLPEVNEAATTAVVDDVAEALSESILG